MRNLRRIAITALVVACGVAATPQKSEASARLFLLGDMSVMNTLGGAAGAMNFGGGLNLEFPMGKVVAFSIGGHYTRLGGAAAVSYAQIPAEFNIYLLHWLYLKAGGYFRFLVAGNPGGYASTDYGLSFGSGLAIPLGKVALIVEGNYQMGLANVTGTSKWVNTSVSAGLRFGGGGK